MYEKQYEISVSGLNIEYLLHMDSTISIEYLLRIETAILDHR
jgi:hypothetical protein